jgi:hypothetical protein
LGKEKKKEGEYWFVIYKNMKERNKRKKRGKVGKK